MTKAPEDRPVEPELGDASRRTQLANERTQLAWWRTGLTALAVGLAVGRVVPELAGDVEEWPYLVLGVGFALYGVLLVWYGGIRAREVEEAIGKGRFAPPVAWISASLGTIGIVLGLATCVVIVAG